MATDALEARMARLEGAYEQIRDRLTTIDGRLASLEAEMHTEIGSVRGEIGELRRELRQQFYWVISLIVVTILVPITLRVLGP